LGLAHSISPSCLVEYSDLLTNPAYIPAHIGLTAASIAWFLVISLSLGAYVANAWPTSTLIDSSVESAWVRAFSDRPQREALRLGVNVPLVDVEVRIKDGQSYRGLLVDYSKDVELASREIVLGPPMAAISPGGVVTEIGGQQGHLMILPASEISGILVRYRARQDSAARNSTLDSCTVYPRHKNWSARLSILAHKCYGKRSDIKWLARLVVIELCLLFIYVLIRRLA
jgi:hypothetical protein